MNRRRASFLVRLSCAATLAAVCWGVSDSAASAAVPLPAPRPIPVRVVLGDEAADLRLMRILDIDVDGVYHGWARAYVDAEQLDVLRASGLVVERLADEGLIGLERLRFEGTAAGPAAGRSIPAQYHTYESLTAELQQIAADHPDLVRLSSIGTSVQGRQLWMVEISADPDVDSNEPEIAYISSMHGDEVVGKELCVGLIHRLIDDYGNDPRVTALVDGAEIWIMPSMNPDGTALGQRWNADGIDLNRNFPDQFVDPVNTTAGREPEVAAVMSWRKGRSLMLSANYHGGSLVANYPFDNNAAGSSTFSPTPAPDHTAFVSLARTYADNNPPMSTNNSVASFDDGITNGADWYVISGGMQDWSYVWNGGFELTIEVGNVKWPAADQLPSFWDDNIESMLSYFERAFEGLRGLVTDADTGLPVAAEIRLGSDPYPVFTDPDVGDYHRLVLPGSYQVVVSAPGYETLTVPGVVVGAGPATVLDVALGPEPPSLQPVDERVEDGGNGVLDAGESAPLVVTLHNQGKAAAGIEARLVRTGWYAELARPDASYPDLAMGAEAETLAPYHEVGAAPGTPPGHKIGLAVAWNTVDGFHGISEPFFLDVGEPSCSSVQATDLPQPVSGVQTGSSSIVVAGGEVDEVTVSVDIQHPYIGDLQVTLVSPQGTHVLLHAGTGGSADNIVGTYGADLTPAEPLSTLRGEPAAGTWTLLVEDDVLLNSGSLQAFGLDLCSRPAEAQTPEMRFRDVARRSDGVLLRWWPYPGLTSYRVYRSTSASSAAAFDDVTTEDADPTDTVFVDGAAGPLSFYLVTGVGSAGEGPRGHFGD